VRVSLEVTRFTRTHQHPLGATTNILFEISSSVLQNYLVLFSEETALFRDSIMSMFTIGSEYYEGISLGVTSNHQQPVV